MNTALLPVLGIIGAGAGEAFRSTAFSGSLLLAVPISLIAGVVSFFSPCVLPLVPGYLSYVTGMTGEQLRSPDAAGTGRAVLGVLLFVLGFGAWFVGLGVVFNGVGSLLRADHQRLLDIVLGSLVIVLGLAFAGLLRPLQREFRVHRMPTVGVLAAPLLGLMFAFGWTPCIGPTLGAVLSLSASDGTTGRAALLASVYSLGLGIPFLVVAVLFGRLAGALGWFRRHGRLVARFGGGMLVAVGVLFVSGLWAQAIANLNGWFAAVSPPV